MVRVEWVDSYGCAASWSSVEEIELVTCPCVSIGFLVAETNDCVAVMPHSAKSPGGTHQGMGELVIPRAAITSIQRLGVMDVPDDICDHNLVRGNCSICLAAPLDGLTATQAAAKMASHPRG